MVILVLDDPSFQLVEGHFEFLSLEIERVDDDFFRPPHLPIQSRDAQAALFPLDASFAAHDLGIDKDVLGARLRGGSPWAFMMNRR